VPVTVAVVVSVPANAAVAATNATAATARETRIRCLIIVTSSFEHRGVDLLDSPTIGAPGRNPSGTAV
jgi:hypothetical protein